jgi:fatty acid desaturase
LKFQDAIGVAFLALAAIGCIGSGAAYVFGALSFWACIGINAFLLAVVREIEHDLIHNLYFRGRPRIQNAMMLAVWPLLANLPHPWFRRRMHLLHHRTSGQDEDFEERLIGNGMKFGPLKLLAMVEPVAAMFLRRKEMATIPFYSAKKSAAACFPVVYLYYVVLLSFAFYQAASWGLAMFGAPLARAAALHDSIVFVNILVVTWALLSLSAQNRPARGA